MKRSYNSQNNINNERIQSVDSIRLLAIICVIAIHTTPFSATEAQNAQYFTLGLLIDQISRFAVPFFFVVSGYFWGLKVRNRSQNITNATNSMAKRLFVIFACWSLIYLIPYNISAIYEHGIFGPIKVSYWNLIGLINNPSYFFFQGTKVHLWFIIALIISLYISYFFIILKQERILLLFSIFLYLTGVMLNSYSDSNLGMHVEFNTRNGPFFGTLLFVSGYFISKFKPDSTWFTYGVLLLLTGLIIQFLEITTLYKLFGTKMLHDYVFSTCLMGIGVALIALSNNKLLHFNGISKIGSMTLGIYAVHYIYVDLFLLLDKRIDAAWWEISYVFIVLILSIITTLLLAKSSLLKRIVA